MIMLSSLVHLFALLSIHLVQAQEQHVLHNQQSKSLLTPFTYEWVNLLEQFHNTLGNKNTSKDNNACLNPVPEFQCKPFFWQDSILDRDAYHLRPHDIKSVIALGDSISAGFGMISERPPFSTVLEYRGKVFSVGADKGEYTIPNFLSTYSVDNPQGPPTGVTLPLSHGKRLNNAVSGAKTQELNSEVDRLIRLLNSNEYKAVKNEWKLITLFIGANNICVLCEPPMTKLPGLAEADIFEENIRNVLTRIKNEVEKSFVNLVALFNVSSVYEASRGDPYCEFVLDPSHLAVCSCVQGDIEQRRAADALVHEYNKRLEKLEAEFKQQDIERFGLSYQPGFEQFPVSKFKQAYFSGIDCFHPNRCANQVMSILLWNNMFSNKLEKKNVFDIEKLEFVCPGPSRPYIQ